MTRSGTRSQCKLSSASVLEAPHQSDCQWLDRSMQIVIAAPSCSWITRGYTVLIGATYLKCSRNCVMYTRRRWTSYSKTLSCLLASTWPVLGPCWMRVVVQCNASSRATTGQSRLSHELLLVIRSVRAVRVDDVIHDLVSLNEQWQDDLGLY